jgi:hypothetical protein
MIHAQISTMIMELYLIGIRQITEKEARAPAFEVFAVFVVPKQVEIHVATGRFGLHERRSN